MHNFLQILFVMWRESVEAMLVVGILHAWLVRQPGQSAALRWMWLGVAAGVGLALLLGWSLFAAESVFEGEAQDWFQAALMLVAALLITHTVLWMNRHGRTLRRDMETQMAAQAQRRRWWGVMALALIAVAREGSETVLFLSGLASGPQGVASVAFWGAIGAGLVLAWATFGVLQWGGRVLSWRTFFRTTEVLLLLLGGALLVSGLEKLIDLQVFTFWHAPVWDSSHWLDDGGVWGSVVSSFTGYRARPAGLVVVALGAYWVWMVLALYGSALTKGAGGERRGRS